MNTLPPNVAWDPSRLSLFDGGTLVVGGPASAPRTAFPGGPVASLHLPVGTVINGRYVVRKVLGEGGMGVVYRVDDPLHPTRSLALKTIHSDMLSAERVSWFKSEFKVMADLRHPHVAAVYDFEPMQGTGDYFFTMDYVRGSDLFAATEGASHEQVIDMVVSVCRALSYLHSRKIVHYDLKPGNVLMSDAGEVKVLDFGLVGAGNSGSLVGTPSYMAPELTLGEGSDHRVDLYSLGIMLYQLLCREVPFTASSMLLLLQKHASEPLPFDRHAERVPAWLRAVIEKLCAKDPAARYRSAGAAVEDINRRSGASYQLETRETKESYILSSRFVGRESERDVLVEHVWRRTSGAPSDAPAALFIGGVSGVGKSRLMREVKHQIQLGGLPFVEAVCYEGGFAEFAPVSEAVEHVLRLAEAVGDTELVAAHQATLARIDPKRGRSDEATGDDDRGALLDALSDLFVRVAERVPYALYFNDLQWAKSGAAEVIARIVAKVAHPDGNPPRLCLLGSYRADEVEGRPLAKLLERDVRTMALGSLDAEQVHALLGSMLGIAAPALFAARVASETQGNPFFVEEVMRALVDRGDVYLQNGEWAAAASVADLEIPASMASVFRRRVSLLDAQAQQVLELIAVHSQPIDSELLLACVDLPDERVHDLVRDLVQRQMLVRLTGDAQVVRIGHDRMRETLYDDADPARRAATHERIAALLAERSPERVDEIAHHYFRSTKKDKALAFALIAGERAERTQALAVAIEHYQNARTLMGDANTTGASRKLAESLADLHSLAGRFDEAHSGYGALLAWPELAALDRRRLLRKIGSTFGQQGDLDEAIASMWACVEALGERRPLTRLQSAWALLRQLTRHLSHRCFGAFGLERTEEGRQRLRELSAAYRMLGLQYFFFDARRMTGPLLASVNAAERAGPSLELCRAYNDLSLLYAALRRGRAARMFSERARVLAAELSSSRDMAAVGGIRAMIESFFGCFNAGVAEGLAAAELCKKAGDPFIIGVTYTAMCFMKLTRGELRSAHEHYLQGMTLLARAATQSRRRSTTAQAGWCEALLGLFDSAESRGDAPLALAERSRDAVGQIMCLHAKAMVRRERSDLVSARSLLERAEVLVRGGNELMYMAPEVRAQLALLLLEPALAGGSIAVVALKNARKLVRRALSSTRRHKMFRERAVHAAAVLAWARGDRRQAEALFAEVFAEGTKRGAHLPVAQARADLGRLLAQEKGRHAEARTQLITARDAFLSFGAAPSAERVGALLSAL